MKKFLTATLLGLALAATAQPLPQIVLKPVFPKLTVERPVWMSEAPDGSGRCFVVYQTGRILVVKKGSDGGDAKEFLNIEARDPKAGGVLYLGAPSGLNFDDWLIDDQYIVTRDQSPIIVRFVADIIDVRRFDPMFCEGFAARIAMETGEVLTQSTQKVTAAAGFYKQSMSDARLINAIEAGPIYPPEDDYVACRY